MTAPLTLLVEWTVHDPDGPADVVLRAATGAYYHASAPGPYHDRIADGSTDTPALSREIWRDGSWFEAAAMDYGRVVLANRDGFFDWVARCYVDGRPLRLLIGPAEGAYDDFTAIFSGTVEQVLIGHDTVELVIRDALAAIVDQPLQSEKYGGTNVGAVGLDGGEELTDVWKPVVDGRIWRCEAVWANADQLIAQVSDRAVSALTVTAVDAGGSTLDPRSQRATLAELQDDALAPPVGEWDWYGGSASDGSYYRLGGSPSGTVTATVTCGAAPADRTPAQLWYRCMRERCGVAAADIVSADIAALDAVAGWDAGYWYKDTVDRRAVLDLLAASAAAWYAQDATGLWRLRRIVDPATQTPVASFHPLSWDFPGRLGDGELMALKPLYSSSGTADAVVPVSGVTVEYATNYTVQSKDALAGIALDQQALYARACSTATWPDAATQAARLVAHPLAKPLTVASCLVAESGASALAAVVDGLLGVARRRWTATLRLSQGMVGVVDIGAVVRLTHDRHGLSGGKNVMITKAAINLTTIIADCEVWG